MRTPNPNNFQGRNGGEERKSGRADEEFHGFPALLGIMMGHDDNGLLRPEVRLKYFPLFRLAHPPYFDSYV
jgi:hypothetical protein